MRENMKQSLKQKLESVIAFAMALVMALVPVNGVVPSLMNVFAAGTYTCTVECDDTVDVDKITVCDSAGNNITSILSKNIVTLANGNTQIEYGGLSSGSAYEVTASPSRDYNENRYVVIEQSISEANNQVTLSAVTKSDVSFTVSIEHATINSATLNTTDLTTQSGGYTIPKWTSPKEEVIISYTMDTGYTAATSWKNPGSYVTTVSDIVSNNLKISLTGATIDAPQGNLEIQSADPVPVNGYYAAGTKVTVALELTNSVPDGCTVKYGTSGSKVTEPTSWEDATGSDKKYTAELTVTETTYCWFGFADTTTTSSMTPPLEIKVDKSGPNVTKISIEGIVEADNSKWINVNKNAEIKITATDTESGLDKIEYYWSDTNSYTANSNAKSVAADNSTQNTFSITYSEDGYSKNYLVFRVYDKLGNFKDGFYSLTDIKYDFTAPTLTVAFTDADGNGLTTNELNKWQTGSVWMQLSSDDVEPEPSSDEEKSGFDKVVVTVKRNGEEVDSRELTSLTDDFELSEDGVNELEIIAYDKAGNPSATYTQTVKIDKSGITSKAVTLNPATTTNAYAGNFTVVASAASVSGIKHVVFTFHDNLSNTDVPCDIIAVNNTAECSFPVDAFPDGFEGTVQAVFYDNTESIISPHMVMVNGTDVFRYNKNGAAIQISANGSWTNGNVPVIVTVSDKITEFQTIEFVVNDSVVKTITNFDDAHYYAGGIEISDNSLSPEGTKVTVNVTSTAGVTTTKCAYVYVDKQAPNITFSGITEGAVYNTNRSLTVSTAENIWQKMQPVSVTATRTIDGITTNLDLGAYTANAETSTDVKNFTEDGVYTVTATAVDAAGNRDSKSITFTIDKTAPVLSINGVSDGAYSSSPVTLNFQAIESFYETNKVTITVERKIEGSTYGSTVNFVNSGKTSSVSNTFSADGDYTITMTAVDAAGNVAATQTLAFTVDVTAPVVSITGTKDYFITSQKVALQFSVVESYFETNQVQISGSRKTADGKVTALDITGWTNTGKTSSFAQEFTEDGYYTITLASTDKAGNAKQQVIHFTIDTEAPVITDLSKYNGKYFTSFKLDEDLEDLITELTAPTVKMTLNGKAYDGSEITEDGKYTLVIEVTDEVGLTESQTIEFAIDNMAPKIIFAGAEDGKTYTEAIRLNLSLENENDTIVKILINGEEQELTKGKASYDLSFNSFGEYTVTVETIDEAGNTNSQSITFTYAEHKNVSYLWILIIAVLVVIALIVVIVVNSKKKRNA